MKLTVHTGALTVRAAILATTALVLTAALLALYLYPRGHPDFEHPALLISDPRLSYPSDILRFKGRYVATDLHGDRLALFDDLDLSRVDYFDPAAIGKAFNSPHFLAVTLDDTLLISNGWGGSIVEIADLDGRRWKEFSGVGKAFRAPHGICVDRDGWIYVGDSLNSRLVRFRDMDGGGWQVFADRDNRVSYIRELVCRDGVVWASNSYENRPGLNPGRGGNILKISDFESGEAKIVFSIPDANITGALPLARHEVLVGLWGVRRRLALIETTEPAMTEFQRLALGTPYGMFFDAEAGQVLVTHIGDLSNPESGNAGGIAVYR